MARLNPSKLVLVAMGAVGLVYPATMLLSAETKPAKQTIFTISDQEGYGTTECLEKPGGCGKIIADGFCESKGFSASAFYRKAEANDVTGSIIVERKPAARPIPVFVIACK